MMTVTAIIAGLLARNLPRCGRARALEYMSVDKKAKAGRIRLVLLRKIGEAFLTGDYPDQLLDETLATYFG